MSTVRSLLLASALALSTTFVAERADACGGCFIPPGPSTQVTAHRMAFAISARRTILWDQIQYTGSPSEFGWVLPIRGKVDVGVSSDQLFQRLDAQTRVEIVGPPPPICPRANRGFAASEDQSSLPGSMSDAGGVQVWERKVVGPYEAVQLAAADTEALKNWFKEHAYVLPDAVAPIVDQYIKEGFGFLAIKLVPTAEVNAMVPIRVAYEGASPTLPLRMVAAGTGANVGIQLFLIGEGRWETKNFPSAEIKTESLVWDYAAMASNWNTRLIETLRQNDRRTFVVESSDDLSKSTLFAGLPPGTTSEVGGTPVFAKDTDETDVERAFPGRANVTVTRLFAELPQSALKDDIEIQASSGGRVPRRREVTNTINHPCPGVEGGSVFGCNAGASGSPAWLVGVAAVVVSIGVARRRK